MKERMTVNHVDDILEIQIPVRQWGLFAFLMICLLFWSVGLVAGFVGLVTGNLSGQGNPLGLVLLGFVAVEVFLLAHASYLVWGTERIVLTADTLAITSDLFGYGRSRVFKIPQIVGLQVNRGFAALPIWGFSRALALTYKGRKHRFGIELPKDEAQKALTEIKGYLAAHR